MVMEEIERWGVVFRIQFRRSEQDVLWVGWENEGKKNIKDNAQVFIVSK